MDDDAVSFMIIFYGKGMKPEYTDNLSTRTIVRMSKREYNEFIDHLGKWKSLGHVF